MESAVDGQAGKENDADGTWWEPFFARELPAFYGPRDEREVSLDLGGLRLGDDDVGHAEMSVGVLLGLSLQEVVERLFATVEAGPVVVGAEELYVAHLLFRCL